MNSKTLKLLFFVSNIPHCVTAEYIVRSFESSDIDFSAAFITQDNYNFQKSGEYLARLRWPVYQMPRIDKGKGTNLWNTPNCVSMNYKNVSAFFSSKIDEGHPDIAIMIPVETGLFEVEFIRTCKQKKVPTLLLQEGLVLRDELPEGDNKMNERDCRHDGKAVKSDQKTDDQFLWFNLTKWVSRIPYRIYHRIKKVFVWHGIPAHLKIHGFGLNGADYVGTLSNYYSRKLIEQGLHPEQLKAVGFPRFDKLVEFREALSETRSGWAQVAGKEYLNMLFPQNWGYAFGTKVAGDFNVDYELAYLNGIPREIAGKKIRITYRLRSEERIGDYNEFIRRFDHIRFEEAGKVDSYESITDHHVLVSPYSTMLLEALFLRRYCCVYDPQKRDYYGYVKSGACLEAWDSASLVASIQGIIGSAEVRNGLQHGTEKYLEERAQIDGGASERTRNYILDIFGNLKQ